MFELVPLAGGVQTLRDLETGEVFHPVVGPMVEARAIHVAPLKIERRLGTRFTVWDVGLGAAANAVALLEELSSMQEALECDLVSFEQTLAPLQFAVEHAERLGYLLPWLEILRTLLNEKLVEFDLPGGGKVKWRLELADFTKLPVAIAPDAVFYDPYSPGKNPSMWTLQHFARLREKMTRPAPLTSYSRSTAVRVTLLLAGFFVGVGGATGEKDQTTVAATELGLLDRPLDGAWLDRVRRSTSARPLGSGVAGPISAEDLTKLETHPQFC